MARAAPAGAVVQPQLQHQHEEKQQQQQQHEEQQQHKQQQQTAATARLPRRVGPASFHDLRAAKRPRKPPCHNSRAHSTAATTTATSTSSSCAAPRSSRPRFSPLQAPFRTFASQREAFSFLDAQPCAPILRTFAVETSSSGQRVFLVTSAELLWAHYKALPPAARHHYEIIRAGSPCNLFFDLEFCRHSNPSLDGPDLVALLLSGVARQLRELWGVQWHESFALELDSSTPDKFSRHVIVRLPGLAFADACHAGRMARRVLLHLLAHGAHNSRAAGLLVAAKSGSGSGGSGSSSSSSGGGGALTSFVDMGVYTRNRAFRLMLSSKFGKTAQLRLTHRWGGCSRCPRIGFHDCLISVLHTPSQHSSIISSRMMGGVRPLSLLRVPDDGGELLQQLPVEWQHVAMLQLRPLEHAQQQEAASAGSSSSSSNSRTWQQQHGVAAGQPGMLQPCFGLSPLPELDAFIASICSTGGVRGEVRSHVLLHCPPVAAATTVGAAAAAGPPAAAAAATMQYAIRGNRWCGNVGRQHKSNGVYYVVDLGRGTYCQRCWDPECRHYRSHHMPLPTDVWHTCRRFLEHLQPPSSPSMPATAAACAFPAANTTAATAAAAASAAGEDDALYLQLLADFEAVHAAATAAAAAAAAQQDDQCNEQQQQQHVGCNSTDSEVDEEEYVQLLMQVEQQVVAQRGQ